MCRGVALTGAVSTEGEELTLVSAESGETVRVVWPAGFGAWRIDGQAVVADPWGSVVGREGTCWTVSVAAKAWTAPSRSARTAS